MAVWLMRGVSEELRPTIIKLRWVQKWRAYEYWKAVNQSLGRSLTWANRPAKH